MTLLLAIHALSISALVESLMMSLIGKMISSISIYFVQKCRTFPNSFKVFGPRMRSNPGWLIIHPSYSVLYACRIIKEFDSEFALSPCVWKVSLDLCLDLVTAELRRKKVWVSLFHGSRDLHWNP
jgi:hypothetical protein